MAYITFQPSDNFSTNLFTGTGSTQVITTGHQPDLIWIKQRTTVRPHVIFDSVNSSNFAGGNSKYIKADSTAVLTANNSTQLTANSSTGFTLGSDDSDQVNHSGSTAIAWSWKGNGAGSANTNGDINSTVSANTTSGFSIVSYTGTLSGNGNTTVGHGLGAVPKMIITKSKSNAENWGVYHKDLTANHILQLNTTSAQINTTSEGTVTAPTSSVFTVNYRGEYGNSGQNYIAYCFAEKKGFSKFGSYTGNGNTDGTFVYTGFKPAFVMLKYASPSGGVGNWGIHDSKRDVDNPVQKGLIANSTAIEDSHDFMDILSNGFKLKSTSSNRNENGSTYIFMAFAEEPLVASNGTPATAR